MFTVSSLKDSIRKILFQRRVDHVCGEHVNLFTGRLRHFLYPGPHRAGTGNRSGQSGQKRSRTRVSHLSGGGPQASWRLHVGHHLLRDAAREEALTLTPVSFHRFFLHGSHATNLSICIILTMKCFFCNRYSGSTANSVSWNRSSPGSLTIGPTSCAPTGTNSPLPFAVSCSFWAFPWWPTLVLVNEYICRHSHTKN